MQDKDLLRRRRLATSDRKRITAYFTAREQREIATAAASQGLSLSSFIASVSLKAARKLNQ
jgi:uncharacterized protein (DUF1778 family)